MLKINFEELLCKILAGTLVISIVSLMAVTITAFTKCVLGG